MEKIMNYKRLFFGYLAFNFICGIILSVLNSKANKPTLKTKDGFLTENVQKMYDYYSNKTKETV